VSRPVASPRAFLALFALPPLVIVLLLLLLAAPAWAQHGCPMRRGTHISIHESNERRTMIVADGERCLEVRSVGAIEFTDDDADVRRLSPGGTLSIEETRGGVTRRVEFAERDGRVTRRYLEDGRPRDDADGAAWTRAILAQVARESHVGAEARAARVLRQGGPQAVVAEVRQIASDGVKRVYLNTLLAHDRLSSDDLGAIVRVAERGVSSDSEKGRILRGVAERRGTDAGVLAAVVEASRSIASDSEKARVLASALAAPSVDPGVRTSAVAVTRTIASDRAKGALLVALVPDAGATDALFEAVDGIASDRERGTVLRAVLKRERLSRPALLATLRAAGRIASDTEKADVLLAAAAHRDVMTDDVVRRAFLDTTRGISSSSQYRRVMDAVVR
jgi:hypothetical protein